MESALFGHERGAFTGAMQRSKGAFEEADGGTLLLDEIGELSPAAQVALLRVLETKCICRVGSSKETKVDVRVLAATHRDLEQMCETETFRWDLFFRLNVMAIVIPPLRERRDDIRPLAQHFLQQANASNRRALQGIEPPALSLLQRYSWPGNVRELRNVIERAVVISQGSVITVDDLSARIREPANVKQDRRIRNTLSLQPRPELGKPDPQSFEYEEVTQVDDAGGDKVPFGHEEQTVVDDGPADKGMAELTRESSSLVNVGFKEKVQFFEATLIQGALAATAGNKTAAARWLSIPHRTLSRKVQDYEINAEHFVGHEAAGGPPSDDFRTRVIQFERQLIADALNESGGNKTTAARLLSLPLRTLVDKIGRYGLG
jgi:DNA-binding NtrC family response regulator